MMRLVEAAKALNGILVGTDLEFSGVSTDSRENMHGKLFVALAGERFDAHDFLLQACERGAVACVVDERAGLRVLPEIPLIKVRDTRLALGALASHWRAKFSIPVIGVTGSNGKTTVKEMCASVLACWLGDGAVLATEGNLNNDIGVPLMLLRLRAGHKAAVIEMGMNHPGEIAYLAEKAKPTVAIVTNAQRAHLAGMGGLNEVAREKGSLYNSLSSDGTAVLNMHDPHASYWLDLCGDHKTLGFSLAGQADLIASYQPDGLVSRVKLNTPMGECQFILPVPGAHNVLNAAGAAAATLAAGAPLHAVVNGLTRFVPAKGRLQSKPGVNGSTLLDDTYNANPDSVRAGIDVLAATPGRKILVLGDMGEIGEMSAQFHDEIGGYAKSSGIDRLFALGEQSVISARNFGVGGESCRSIDALADAIRPLLDPDVTVLIKGSRFMRMERIVDALSEASSRHGE